MKRSCLSGRSVAPQLWPPNQLCWCAARGEVQGGGGVHDVRGVLSGCSTEYPSIGSSGTSVRSTERAGPVVHAAAVPQFGTGDVDASRDRGSIPGFAGSTFLKPTQLEWLRPALSRSSAGAIEDQARRFLWLVPVREVTAVLEPVQRCIREQLHGPRRLTGNGDLVLPPPSDDHFALE